MSDIVCAVCGGGDGTEPWFCACGMPVNERVTARGILMLLRSADEFADVGADGPLVAAEPEPEQEVQDDDPMAGMPTLAAPVHCPHCGAVWLPAAGRGKEDLPTCIMCGKSVVYDEKGLAATRPTEEAAHGSDTSKGALQGVRAGV